MTRNIRPRMNKREYDAYIEWKKERSNILIIPDLHSPYTLDSFLQFCIETYNEHKCDTVVFLGDILDNHASSFHKSDPKLANADHELNQAKKIIAQYYKAFPIAKVCMGNHDDIVARKVFDSGLSNQFMRPISEVLETPKWEYSDEHIINNILFTHGTSRQARQRCLQESISVCQGHFHSKTYLEYYQSREGVKFAMQLGCGVDRSSLAFAYGKNFAMQQLNVGVIKNNGTLPIIIPML